MKQTKHILLLAALLLGTLTASAHDFVKNGIYYNLPDKVDFANLQVSVTCMGGYWDAYKNEYRGHVVIPSTVTYSGKTYRVTSIEDEAFSGCDALSSISIPSTVTRIGDEAFFRCSGLVGIVIPASVGYIGDNVLGGCANLASIVVEKGNEVYDSRGKCNAIINTVSNILVAGCCTTVIPEGVSRIGDWAFNGRSELTSITIPEGVTSIGNSAFYDCRSLTSITIPEGVTSIGDKAFFRCRSLTSITIPENSELTSIGDYAFAGCLSLASINIPEGVVRVGYGAFESCSSIKLVTVHNARLYEDLKRNCNLETAQVKFDVVFDFEVSDGIPYLRKYYGQGGDVVLPKSYNGKNYKIGNHAFEDCSSLTSITIPEGVTSIGKSAFRDCSSLTSITIPENSELTSIGDYAFRDCSSLTSFTLPASVTSIGVKAFGGCSGELFVNCNIPSPNSRAFSDSKFTKVTIGDKVTSIGSSAFSDCSSLTTITIPENSELTSIGDFAFYNCSSLTSINIPEGVTSIGSCAFWGCKSLTSVTFLGQSMLTTVRNDAFHDCSSLTSVHISDIAAWCKIDFHTANSNPLFCAENLYLNGALVTELTIPESVSDIGKWAFYNCSSLTAVSIPKSVEWIGNNAFFGCSNLATIVAHKSWRKTFKERKKDFFSYCPKLVKIKYVK